MMRILILISIFCSMCVVRAITLGDVVVSIEDRQKVVNQRKLIEFENFTYVTYEIEGREVPNDVERPEINEISWKGGLGENPTSGGVNQLTTVSKVEVLNQAIAEFDRLKVEFAKISVSELEVNDKIGSIGNYIYEDFAELPKVTPSNYNVLVVELARRVQNLKELLLLMMNFS